MSVNRDALLIHLKDLRTLETIINESTDKKNKLTERVNNGKFIPMSIEEPRRPAYPDTSKIDDDLSNGINMSVWCGLLCLLFALLFFFEKRISSFDKFLYISGLITFGIMFIVGICIYIDAKKSRKEVFYYYNRQLGEYHSKMEEHRKKLIAVNHDNEKRKAEFINDKKSMSDLAGEISVDIEHYKDLLNKAYSADIIPMQFRNIEGVYYLYDFLSTSQLSLSDAIINANMQEIRNKLDEVINMQKEMVIQQARSNAQIADLRETTEQVLESARITEQNTFVAAQYARISAINSELSLNLQSEQLAYQKADFWIK